MCDISKPLILLIGLNELDEGEDKELIKNSSFNFVNNLEIKLYEHLKKDIVGVLIAFINSESDPENFSAIYTLPNLKVVSCKSSGLDYLDLDRLHKKNVVVKNCAEETADSTSNVAVVLILNLTRKIFKVINGLQSQLIHVGITAEYIGNDVKGKVLGIVGFGAIGQRVAYKMSLAFGMKIVYNQRNKRSDSIFPYYESLNEMLPIVDILVVSCSLNASTKHLIDLKRLKLMKPTSFLINVSIGSIIETNDLVQALRCGFISGAGLDVTDPEPLPASHPLLHMDNVIVLPHIGTLTVETEHDLVKAALSNLKNALEMI